MTNPTMTAEVLASSTEALDRGESFRHHRQIPLLAVYVRMLPARTA